MGLEPLDDEPDLDRELRALLFAAAGTTGNDNSVQDLARVIFTDNNNGQNTEPNLTAAAIRVVAAAGDEKIHGEIVDLYREGPNAAVRGSLSNGTTRSGRDSTL